jgi:tyrosyl-tRNA synthetase
MTHHPKSDFLHVMQTRGYLADCTDLEGLDAALMAGVVISVLMQPQNRCMLAA